jgi:hypothetical protein
MKSLGVILGSSLLHRIASTTSMVKQEKILLPIELPVFGNLHFQGAWTGGPKCISYFNDYDLRLSLKSLFQLFDPGTTHDPPSTQLANMV